MEFQTKDLQQVLKVLKLGLPKGKEDIKLITFTGKKIWVASDGVIISVPLETDFAGSVDAIAMIKIVNAVRIIKLDLTLMETKLKIKGKGLNVSLNVTSEQPLPEGLHEAEEIRFFTAPKNLQSGIKLCEFSIDKSPDFITNCICITNNSIYSTDRMRVSCVKLETEIKVSDEVLLTASGLKIIDVLDVTRYAVNEAYMYFKDADGTICGLNRKNGEFPDCSTIFNFEHTGNITFNDELKEAVSTASITSKNNMTDVDVITIAINDEIITVSSDNEIGEIEVDINMDTKQDNSTFCIDPGFLRQALNQAQKGRFGMDRIEFTMNDFKHIIGFTSE